MECINCENMAKTCTVEKLYGIGQLKACPYIKEPVLNEYGWIMNPPFTEKYQLSNGHIFLIPEDTESGWIINWIITKNGSGSCGKTKPDLFILSYKTVLKDILSNHRLNELDILEIKEIFDHKFDDRRTFSFMENDHKSEEMQSKEKTEYISPFEDIHHGNIGEQMELF